MGEGEGGRGKGEGERQRGEGWPFASNVRTCTLYMRLTAFYCMNVLLTYYMHMNNHMHSALQSIEKEIEKEQDKELKLFTHIHTTASTA